MATVATPIEKRRGLRLSLAGVLVVTFVVLLFLGQVLTGTPVEFAFFVATFISLGAWTVKLLGGPTTLQGLSVTVFLLQHVAVSQTAKVFFMQPATDRMLVPMPTIFCYNLAMLGIFCGTLVYRWIGVEKIKPLYDLELNVQRLGFYAVVLSIFAVLRAYMIQRFGVVEGGGGGVYVGGFVGPLRQFGFLSNLGVAMSTAFVILKSDGKRCFGVWNSLAIISSVLFGVLAAERANAANSLIIFALTLYAFKFKLRPTHYVFFAIVGYLLQFIIFPYSLYARGEGGVRIGAFEDRIAKAANLLVEFTFYPRDKKQVVDTIDPLWPWHRQRMYYYGQSINTLERYSIILTTDNIVNSVLQRGAKGGDTLTVGFDMLLPRFLNPDKEALGTAAEIANYGDGLINPGDYYTQITMGIVPEGFYAYKWAGVFFLPFIVSLCYFSVYRLLFRSSMFKNVFVVAFLFSSTWIYSEATMSGQTLNILQTPLYFIIAFSPLAIIASTLARRPREAKFLYEKHDGEPELALNSKG